MSAENFSRMAQAVGRLGHEPSEEPVAVVRCEDGWRTLFADGSSHPGRPCHRVMMDELGAMVDGYRADEDELRRLAVLWQAIEEEVGGEALAQADRRQAAVAAENVAAASAAERIIDVEAIEEIDALERAIDDDLARILEGLSGGGNEPLPLELSDLHDVPAPRAAPHQRAEGTPPQSARRADPRTTPPTASQHTPQASRPAGERPATATPEGEWRSSSTFVPWSVVETMIDVELDEYFKRAS